MRLTRCSPRASGSPDRVARRHRRVLAAADDNDPDHSACVALLAGRTDELITTALVVAEAAFLIERQLGACAEAGFFRSLGNGDARIVPLTVADLNRTAELIERYADFPLGGTDASLVALAERLGLNRIATLDRRHFSVVQPSHVDAFRLVP